MTSTAIELYLGPAVIFGGCFAFKVPLKKSPDKAVISCQSFVIVPLYRHKLILKNSIRWRRFPRKTGCRGGVEGEGLSEMEILGSGLVGRAQNEG